MSASDDESLSSVDEVEEEEKEEEKEEDTTLASSDVVTKYQEAAKITNAALLDIISKCVPGARVIELCKEGDRL